MAPMTRIEVNGSVASLSSDLLRPTCALSPIDQWRGGRLR